MLTIGEHSDGVAWSLRAEGRLRLWRRIFVKSANCMHGAPMAEVTRQGQKSRGVCWVRASDTSVSNGKYVEATCPISSPESVADFVQPDKQLDFSCSVLGFRHTSHVFCHELSL
jgi:hypothetical protein